MRGEVPGFSMVDDLVMGGCQAENGGEAKECLTDRVGGGASAGDGEEGAFDDGLSAL